SHIPSCVLLSFPTRRSSDLFFWVRVPAMPAGSAHRGSPREPPRRGHPAITRDQPRVVAFTNPRPLPHVLASSLVSSRQWSAHRQDRKSTRLNSSHVKISYAV